MNAKRNCGILVLLAAGLFGLAGCGSSDGPQPMGTLNIGLTDAPVDNAVAVVINFTGLELKPAGGPPEIFPLDPDFCDEPKTADSCGVDLLTLQGTDYRTLFVGNIPAGDYQWVRLLVNAEQDVHDSYVTVKDEAGGLMDCPLWIPSGAETGLKIVSGVTVTANGVSNYMLDFDARKSITAPPGLPSRIEECVQNYILKPAIRIVDETETGSIAGMVSPTLLDGCRDAAPMDGVADYLSVYVFEDFEGLATLDDYDGEGDPITSAIVKSNDMGLTYAYEVGYLRAGDYKLGLTCTSDVDVMAGQVDQIADNYNCEVTADSDCKVTEPAFDFIAERGVRVLIDTLNNGDFPEPAQDP